MFRRPAHFCSLLIPLTVFVSGMGKGKKRHAVKTVKILNRLVLYATNWFSVTLLRRQFVFLFCERTE